MHPIDTHTQNTHKRTHIHLHVFNYIYILIQIYVEVFFCLLVVVMVVVRQDSDYYGDSFGRRLAATCEPYGTATVSGGGTTLTVQAGWAEIVALRVGSHLKTNKICLNDSWCSFVPNTYCIIIVETLETCVLFFFWVKYTLSAVEFWFLMCFISTFYFNDL